MRSHTTPTVFTPPRGNPRFPLLDSMRAFAALVVILGHTQWEARIEERSRWGWLLHQYGFSVTLFFLISGFVLYRPFVAARVGDGRAPRIRDYARGRVLRIVPGYWVALTLLALWPGLRGNPLGSHWWLYYLFGQTYVNGRAFTGISPCWSLSTEVCFYALLPLYALGLARLSRGRTQRAIVRLELGVLALVVLVGWTVRYLVEQNVAGYKSVEFTLAGTCDWFALGMGLAVLSAALHGRERQPWAIRLVERRPWLPWVAAAGILVLLTLGHGDTALFPLRTWYGVFSLLLLLPCVFGQDRGGWPRGVLRARPLAFLGIVTYGTFLYHRPLVTWLWQHGVGASGNPWLGLVELLAAALAITVVLATASYYLVERPFLRMKTRRAKSARTARPRLQPAYVRAGSAPR